MKIEIMLDIYNNLIKIKSPWPPHTRTCTQGCLLVHYQDDKTTIINPVECNGWLTQKQKSTNIPLNLNNLNTHIVKLK